MAFRQILRWRTKPSLISCRFTLTRGQHVAAVDPLEAPNSADLIRYEPYFNGNWISSAFSDKTFQVHNPYNGKVISEMSDMDATDAGFAIEAAAKAFPIWSKTTALERSRLLYKWHALISENTAELAEILTEENGKPLMQAEEEVNYAASFVEWYAAEARRNYGETFEFSLPNRRSLVIKQPRGVAGIITPWNLPVAMFTRKVAPALAAGCTIVVKVPEDTPHSPLALTQLAEKAGFPPGVFNVISCSRVNAAAIGSLMCEHPDIATISFTGSSHVGKILLAQSSQDVKRVSLELGGLNPVIIFKSADLAYAIPNIVAAKFRNSGQTCVSPQKFFIHEDVYDEAVDALAEACQNLNVGDPMNPHTQIGPLINSRGLNKVQELVDDAVLKGAEVLAGGSRAREVGELFFHPTLLSGVTEYMDIYHEEVFGPVISTMKFKTEEEVLQKANDTNMGLASYFYSSDLPQCYRMMEGLQAGMVGCNDSNLRACESPIGGFKQSGLGREGGKHGMEEFLEIKMCAIGI